MQRIRLAGSSVVCLSVFAAPVVAVYAPLGMVPLQFIATLGIAAAGGVGVLRLQPALRPVAWGVAALAAWGAASALWSIAPLASLQKSLALVALFASALMLANGALAMGAPLRQSVSRYLLCGLGLGLAVLSVEGLSGGALARAVGLVPGGDGLSRSYFDRTSSILALFVWPGALGLLRLGWRRAGLVLLAIPALLFSIVGSATSFVAYTAGLTVFAVAWYWPRLAKFGLVAAVAGGIVLAPLLPPLLPSTQWAEAFETEAPPPFRGASLAGRLEIWRFAAARIAERPVLGWGLHSSRLIATGTGELPSGYPALPLHPHNAALQWWLELGAVGAALAGALLLAIVARLRPAKAGISDGRFIHAALLAQAATAVVIAMSAYGIWQSWWLATIMLAAFLGITLAQGVRGAAGPSPAP